MHITTSRPPGSAHSKPYVGFGIGAARVHEDRDGTLTLQVGSLPPGSKVQIDEWRTAFAYQARVGASATTSTGGSACLPATAFINIDGGHRDGIFPGVTVHSGAVRNHSLELGAAFKF
jgi:hypothetical protein